MSGSSNAYANGSHQNSGNVLTDRSTTRVHAPPGGKSQLDYLFGSDDSNSNKNNQKKVEEPKKDDGVQYAGNNNYRNNRSNISSNAYANGSNQNCGNVLTDRSTTRVHAPPGGEDHISFG